MLAYIKGKVAYIEGTTVVLQSGDLGYEILVTTATAAGLSRTQEVMLYLYMHVKDDGITLYGFKDMEEKRMFLNLISVTGIGCKVAISVLSGISVSDLAVSIATEDTAMLSNIKGIGKKTAARIILELKEKVASLSQDAQLLGAAAVYGYEGSGAGAEALEALAALGLSRSECAKAVSAAVAAGIDTTEQIIGYALKNMGK